MNSPDKTENVARDASEQREAVEAWLGERNIAQRYLDVAAVIMLVLDKDGKITLLNRKGSEILEYPEGTLFGKNWFDTCVPERVRNGVWVAFQQLMAGQLEPVEYYENPVVTRSGKERIIAWHNALLIDDRENIVGSLSSGTDITDRKRAEEALRESEERYRKLAESTTDMIYIADRDGSILYANASAAAALGFDANSIVGKRQEQLFPPEVAPSHAGNIKQVFETGELFKADRVYRFGSEETWLNTRLMPLRDENGQVTSVMGVSRNITDRKRAEEALRESERTLRTLIDASPEAIFLMGTDGTVLIANETLAHRLGRTVDEITGHKVFDFLPAEVAANRSRQLAEVVHTGKSIRFEDSSFERNVEHVVCPLTDEGGTVVILAVLSTDQTERKRVEAALLESQQELKQRVAEIRLNEARLEAVLQLSHMTEAPLQQITDFALEQAVALTKSKIGYLAFMNEDETVLTMHSWSKEAMAKCAIADKPLVYPLVTTGLWGEAARQRKPIVTNDYAAPNPLKKGTPAGHVHLCRHMNVPIFDGGRIVIVAGVGNKEEDYDESDVRQLTLLMEGMWTIIQRQRVQTELLKYREHLEQSVKERTADLAESEAKHRYLVETTDTGYVILDEEGRVEDANDEYLRITGHHTLGEIVRRSVTEWTAPYDLARNTKEVEKCLQEGKIRQLEIDYVRSDGGVVPIEINASRVDTKQGKRILTLCRDITQRKRAEEALQRQHRILKHLLQASDHERQIIAYEIHDELAQQLAGAIMQFETFAHLKDSKPRLAAKAYDAGMTMLQQGHFETRRLIAGVRPPILDESGVLAAVSHLVQEHSRLKGPKIDYHSRVTFDRLAPALENAIYRIVQEGLTNACQHSKSEKVRVSLVQREDRVQIDIRDWGVGFDTKAVQENRFGLVGIRQRARLLGGKCSIRSTIGKGTRIAVDLPVVARE